MKKRVITILILVALLLIICGAFKVVNVDDNTIVNTIVEEIEDEVSNVIVSEETEELVTQTKEAIESGDDLTTTETIENADEESLEEDATVEQENISYDGTNTGDGLSLLGAYQGLTYYSQADSRGLM